MVNFGPVTPEFKRVKVVHSSLISSSATFASLIDLAGSVLSFSGAITTQFCFTYTLEASLLCRAGYTLGSATHF